MWEYLPRQMYKETNIFDNTKANEIKKHNMEMKRDKIGILNYDMEKSMLTIDSKQFGEFIKRPHLYLDNENPYLPWYLKKGCIVFVMPSNNDGSTSIIFFPSDNLDKIGKIYKFYQ